MRGGRDLIFFGCGVWAFYHYGRTNTSRIACAAIVVWAVIGQIFRYLDTWRLVINTGAMLLTFAAPACVTVPACLALPALQQRDA